MRLPGRATGCGNRLRSRLFPSLRPGGGAWREFYHISNPKYYRPAQPSGVSTNSTLPPGEALLGKHENICLFSLFSRISFDKTRNQALYLMMERQSGMERIEGVMVLSIRVRRRAFRLSALFPPTGFVPSHLNGPEVVSGVILRSPPYQKKKRKRKCGKHPSDSR